MNKKRWWIYVIISVVIIYLLGPRPSSPEFSADLPKVSPIESLENQISRHEASHKLRPDNEARIVWANGSSKNITEYSILYLHGFSASQGEGEPVHKNIARRFGCNLYLSRLAEHGVDTTEKLVNLTADKLWESAKESFAIASAIGKKVIVMGTSTGASLAIFLASKYPQIHSLILLSPNIEIFDGAAWILNNPWGLQIARIVNGSDYVISQDSRPEYKQYWSHTYRMEAVVALEEFLESAMTPETFQKVRQPALMLYYYRDEIHQDSVVKVDAMHRMFASLGTPADKKRSVAIPKAGNHVLGSYIKSNDLATVEKEIEKFMSEVLRLK